MEDFPQISIKKDSSPLKSCRVDEKITLGSKKNLLDTIGFFYPHIRIGARESTLSKAQVREIIRAMLFFYPSCSFFVRTLKTSGDFDKKTPLSEVVQDDFFTKEIDLLLIKGKIDVAIHSAKDLPQKLSTGLRLFAMTRGVDSSDVLLLRPGKTVASLPLGSCIGSSSLRRQKIIKQIRPDLQCISIRGTIEERISLLYNGKIDGVLMARAALIRLSLLHLNAISIPFPTQELQGKLAIVGRKEDLVFASLFAPLHNAYTFL